MADLFIIRKDATAAGPSGGGAGVFTAPQSMTFPIAVCLVTTVSRAARTIGRSDAESTVVPLLAAMAVGAAIWAVTVADSGTRPHTLGEWLTTMAAAFLNSLVLFAATLGIEKF